MVMAVPDLEPGMAFYGKTLGLPESGGSVDMRGVDGGSAGDGGRAYRSYRIGLTDLILQEDPSAVPYAQLAGGARTEVDHFALYVEDVNSVNESLKRRGIAFRDKPHTTESGHRNMQRSLVSFEDPYGFTLQLSQAVDPRPERAQRVEAKKAMTGQVGGIGAFGGIDHVSTYCTDYKANRTLYRDILGLGGFFYSTTREDGAAVGKGFEQGAFAVGGTDIELASDDEWRNLARGPVRELGFQISNLERARDALRTHGVPFEEQPRNGAPRESGRSSLAFNSPDGMQLEISTCAAIEAF